MRTNRTAYEYSNETTYEQERVLIRVPRGFQMTRSVAIDTFTRDKFPKEVMAKLNDLDDSAVLVLFLAHEHGKGLYSRWHPYIASLPPEPNCGYSRRHRPQMLDAINAYRQELGVETQGWPQELIRATEYADKIAEGLNKDVGDYILTPDKLTSKENIEWALCHVASRATAGDTKYGSLRMIPVLDMINHDSNAGAYVELTGKERVKDGHFLDASETDAGTFVLRSLRHGRRKPLRKGQELLVNYNVPNYSPLDWLVTLGFVPPERWGPWQKIDAALPPVRTDGPFSTQDKTIRQATWQERERRLQDYLKRTEL